MSLLRSLFGIKDAPKQRVRVCIECGMPVAEHKDWCSILKGQIAIQRAAKSNTPRPDEGDPNPA